MLFPVGMIVFVLIALVVIPWVVGWRTDRLAAHRNEVAQPARDLVNLVQWSLAREMSALRGFVITGDELFLSRYEAAREEERRAYAELTPLVEEMDPGVVEAYAELRSRALRWHDRITEAEILSRQIVPDAFIERLRSEEVRYEEALEAAEVLRTRIVAEVEENRLEIEQMERTSLIMTALLALLAIGASLGALWLGRRLQMLVEESERRREEVERVGENRASLLRGITHDVKNPLGAALGHLELLHAGIVTEPERRQDSLARCDRSIRRALGIIDDLLELSRAEAGELPLSREPVDLATVAREIGEDQRVQAEQAGLDLEVEVPETLPVVVADIRKVREIIRNLISNAVKYTPSGGRVILRARAAEGSPGALPERLQIDVLDTGPGIAEEEREDIFREFSRLDGNGTTAGTGIGLAISRQVARLLGGDIEVESEPGRGSTFTFWLPLDDDAPC